MTSSVAIERQGPVGLVTLNRPERHNAFDDALIAELTEALRSMEAEDGIRCVVLSSVGKSFSAGADLNWMRRVAGASLDENKRDAMALAALMRTLAELQKPTVARVQGPAYGGGVGLIACCDVAVATVNATFALTEAKLGLIPSVISPYVVAAIGARAARRYFLTGEKIEAADAWRLGLVHEIARRRSGPRREGGADRRCAPRLRPRGAGRVQGAHPRGGEPAGDERADPGHGRSHREGPLVARGNGRRVGVPGEAAGLVPAAGA